MLTADYKKLHTFVILAHTDSTYLEECIESLLNQTVKSNIILSTSNPVDYMQQTCSRYNIPLHVNKNSKGIADNWSFAYSKVETPFLTFAHYDDIYTEHYTENMLGSMQKNDTILGFCDYQEYREDKTISHNYLLTVKRILLLPYYLRSHLQSEFLKKITLSFGSPICCPSVMLNKELVGDFAFNDDYKINLDWEAWYRLTKYNGSFTYCPAKLVKHRIHQNSETSAGVYNKIRHNEDNKMFVKIWGKAVGNIISAAYKLSYLSNK